MNRLGAYTKLLANSASALSAAIEIYNKPKIEYRDETFVILLVNAWELCLKAVLSKNKVPIYYTKKRGQPYRTLSVDNSMRKAWPLIPQGIDTKAVLSNLHHLSSYRDNAIHFYNYPDVSVLIYGLAQASVLNLCDHISGAFNRSLSDEFTLHLLPISWGIPIDPVTFIQKHLIEDQKNPLTDLVQKAVSDISVIETGHGDTARLISQVTVTLQSTKKLVQLI